MESQQIPMSQQAQAFMQIFSSLPPAVQAELRAVLCASVSGRTREVKFGGYRAGPAPPAPAQQTAVPNQACPTCGRPLG